VRVLSGAVERRYPRRFQDVLLYLTAITDLFYIGGMLINLVGRLDTGKAGQPGSWGTRASSRQHDMKDEGLRYSLRMLTLLHMAGARQWLSRNLHEAYERGKALGGR
jgi:hypothetical protein